MFAVLPMDVTVDYVIDVPRMRNRHVFATDAVQVFACVGAAGVTGIAGRANIHVEFVLVHVTFMGVVQMTVMDVIDVAVVLYR